MTQLLGVPVARRQLAKERKLEIIGWRHSNRKMLALRSATTPRMQRFCSQPVNESKESRRFVSCIEKWRVRSHAPRWTEDFWPRKQSRASAIMWRCRSSAPTARSRAITSREDGSRKSDQGFPDSDLAGPEP